MYDQSKNYYNNLQQNAMNNQHFNAYGESNFYGADAGAQTRLNAMISQPFSLQFANGSTNSQTAVIWDAANSILAGSSGNFGNNANLTISVVDGFYSYAQMLFMIASMSIQMARIDIEGATSSTVVNNPVSITTFDQFGNQQSQRRLPGLNKFQQITNVVTVDYVFPLDQLTKVTQTVPASSTIIYRFYPSALINAQHALNGNQPTQVFSNPRNQGVVQLPVNYGTPDQSALLLGHQ